MKKSDKGLLGDISRRRFFRHPCDASFKGAFEYGRSDKWSRDVRLGYLKSDAIAQSLYRRSTSAKAVSRWCHSIRLLKRRPFR